MVDLGYRKVRSILHDKNIPLRNVIFSEQSISSDNTTLGHIIIPDMFLNARQMAIYLKKGVNIDDYLVRVYNSENYYKLEVEGLIYYIPHPGDEVLIIIMDREDDDLYLNLTDFSDYDDYTDKNTEYNKVYQSFDLSDDEEFYYYWNSK